MCPSDVFGSQEPRHEVAFGILRYRFLFLGGNIEPSTRPVNESEVEASNQSVLSGGRWVPRWCVPRQRVAIIVPFRDRESHLSVFLNVLHPFLQRQLVDYTIFIVEQVIR